MTHDGMWFFHCLQEFGIEVTNKINKSAILSLSSIEIRRIRSILGFKKALKILKNLGCFLLKLPN